MPRKAFPIFANLKHTVPFQCTEHNGSMFADVLGSELSFVFVRVIIRVVVVNCSRSVLKVLFRRSPRVVATTSSWKEK